MKFSSENKIINATGFQGAWWSVALYQEKAIYLVILLISLHFVYLKNNRAKELYFVLAVSAFGILMDSLLFNFNFFDFTHPMSLSPAVVPLWLMFLWLAFASTLNHCLSWLFKNKYIAFIVGGMGGSLSYLGAANLGAMTIMQSKIQAFLMLFIIWGAFFLIVRSVYYKFNFGKLKKGVI